MKCRSIRQPTHLRRPSTPRISSDWMMTAGWAPRLEIGIPPHQPVTLEEPTGAYGRERFPASASLARKYGWKGPPPTSRCFLTGRCLLPRLPIVGEKEAELPYPDARSADGCRELKIRQRTRRKQTPAGPSDQSGPPDSHGSLIRAGLWEGTDVRLPSSVASKLNSHANRRRTSKRDASRPAAASKTCRVALNRTDEDIAGYLVQDWMQRLW